MPLFFVDSEKEARDGVQWIDGKSVSAEQQHDHPLFLFLLFLCKKIEAKVRIDKEKDNL